MAGMRQLMKCPSQLTTKRGVLSCNYYEDLLQHTGEHDLHINTDGKGALVTWTPAAADPVISCICGGYFKSAIRTLHLEPHEKPCARPLERKLYTFTGYCHHCKHSIDCCRRAAE